MEYEIKGGTLPVVICYLDKGERMISQPGAMAWMTPGISMQTEAHGGIGKAISRTFSGEKFFQNIFTARETDSRIAFASSLPGCIRPFNLFPGESMILQKMAFLASTENISLSSHLIGNIGAGLFGGEGFWMQKVTGEKSGGTVFAEFDGYLHDYTLEKGEQLIVSTGHVAAFSPSVKIDIKAVGGVKNVLFGSEGFFHTTLTGPGKVWLHTMPISRLGGLLRPFVSGKQKS